MGGGWNLINTAIGRILSVAISSYTDPVSIFFLNSRIILLNAQAFNIAYTELAVSSVSENNKALLVKIHSYISSPSHLSKQSIHTESKQRGGNSSNTVDWKCKRARAACGTISLCVLSTRVRDRLFTQLCWGWLWSHKQWIIKTNGTPDVSLVFTTNAILSQRMQDEHSTRLKNLCAVRVRGSVLCRFYSL